jgi:hypothetical protein
VTAEAQGAEQCAAIDEAIAGLGLPARWRRGPCGWRSSSATPTNRRAWLHGSQLIFVSVAAQTMLPAFGFAVIDGIRWHPRGTTVEARSMRTSARLPRRHR